MIEKNNNFQIQIILNSSLHLHTKRPAKTVLSANVAIKLSSE